MIFQGFPGFPGSVRVLCRKIPENSKFLLEKKNKQKKTGETVKNREKNWKTGKSLKSRKKQEKKSCRNRAFLFRLQSVSKSLDQQHNGILLIKVIKQSIKKKKKKKKKKITLFFLIALVLIK